MNECLSCNVYNECEIIEKSTQKEKECPCQLCLVKTLCTQTCEEWELFYKNVMFNLSKDEGKKESKYLTEYINNKYHRQRMLRLIKGISVDYLDIKF